MENNELDNAPSADAPRKRRTKRGQIDYLSAAQKACASGDEVLGMHLYLAAYEKATQDGSADDPAAIESLREAWDLALSLKERSIAEYVFEKIGPYLAPIEIAEFSDALQELALDRLVQFGFSREDLEGLGIGDASDERADASSEPAEAEQVDTIVETPADAQEQVEPEQLFSSKKREKYDDLAGYERTVALMRTFGIGERDDESFDELVQQLNAKHGLNRMPAPDTLLFCAAAREDANRFLAATEHELGLPVVRMSLEESFQGVPMLVISAEGIDFRSRQSFMRMGFSQPMTLVMEDVDLWQMPDFDFDDDKDIARAQAAATKSAREALASMRSAIQSPNVYVLATASDVRAIDPFFMELLDPMTIVDIDLPNDEERLSMWGKMVEDHPSLAGVAADDVVRLSAGLPRFDIAMAVREAIEEAYKFGLLARRYVPVSAQNLFEKLAAYQPLESNEYRELEQKVLDDFRGDLDHLGDFLNGLDQ